MYNHWYYKEETCYIILRTIEWMNLAKKNNKDSIRAYHRGVKTACLTVWPNAVYIFRYYLEISIIDQRLVSLLLFANKAGHSLCLSLARTFTLSHTPLTWFCFALWKSNSSYSVYVEPLEKKGSIFKFVSDRDVMTYSNDLICIKWHYRWPDCWNAYLNFCETKIYLV